MQITRMRTTNQRITSRPLVLIGLVIGLLALAACQPVRDPAVVAAERTAIASGAPLPATTETPEASASDALGVGPAMATVSTRSLRVRSLPTDDSEVVAAVDEGDTFPVTAISSDGEWIQIAIEESPDGLGWISAEFVTLQGDITNIEIVEVAAATEEATGEATEEATAEATEVATEEATEEATIEATAEVTEEATVETTPEVTETLGVTETAEVTEEATEEATTEPDATLTPEEEAGEATETPLAEDTPTEEPGPEATETETAEPEETPPGEGESAESPLPEPTPTAPPIGVSPLLTPVITSTAVITLETGLTVTVVVTEIETLTGTIIITGPAIITEITGLEPETTPDSDQ